MIMPIVVMPDADLVAVTALRGFLASRSEDFCQGVTVGTQVPPATTPSRFVRVRRHGGGTLSTVIDEARLDVLIWHDSPFTRMQLAQLVRGFLVALTGVYGGVTCYGGTAFMTPLHMPDPDDDTREITMLTVDVRMRGTQLN